MPSASAMQHIVFAVPRNEHDPQVGADAFSSLSYSR
jgi:hypothetical protein